MSGPWLRVTVLVFGALVVHEAILRGLRIDGIRPDFMLCVAVVAGLVAGPVRGAVIAFLCGIAADLFLPTPFGLSALVWCLLAYTIGSMQDSVLPHNRASLPIIALVASAVGVVLFAFAGAVLGQPGMVTPHLLVIVAVIALVNSLFSVPIAWAVRWATRSGETERAYT